MRRFEATILSGLLSASTASALPETVGSMRPCPAPPDLQASDCLGSVVVADANQLLATARGRDASGNRAGGVARWVREGRVWLFDRWIDSPRPAAGQEFGHALALRGSSLAAGAPSDDLRGTDAGAAWAMQPSADAGWTNKSELIPSSPEAGERFGAAVATNGQRVAVAAPYATVSGLPHAGRVLVYEPSGTGFAAPVALTAAAPAAEAFFGEAVACDGSWVIVGVPSSDAGAKDAGQVLAFRKTPLGWTLSQTIAGSQALAGARFGQSVAIEGNRLWIGEPRGGADGRLHLFVYASNRFTLSTTIEAPVASDGADFGWSIACSGTRAISGAPVAEADGALCGVAQLVDATSTPVAPVARIHPHAAGELDLAGTSVALSGSVLAFGAPGRSAGAFATGAVYAADLQFDCDQDGFADALSIVAGDGDQDGDGLPNACDCLGDLDGDQQVNTADLSLLLLDFSAVGWPMPSDLDENGLVDTGDIALLLLAFDPCPGA